MIIFQDKPREVSLHHFKIVQLRTYPDTKENNEVKVLYNFYFYKILPNKKPLDDDNNFSW